MSITVDDMYLRHQVQLSQYSTGQMQIMSDILKVSHDKIVAILNRKDITKFNRERQLVLLRDVSKLLSDAYAGGATYSKAESKKLAKVESKFNHEALVELSPEEQAMMRVTGTTIAAAAASTPYQGGTMGKWYASLEANERRVVVGTIRQGFVLGRTNSEVVNDLRPVFNKATNDLKTVVRSGVQHMASVARQLTLEENSDIVDGIEWLSTLDGRTTIEICAPRDGMAYTLKGEPIEHGFPFLGGPGNAHWNCRSTSIPMLKGADQDIDRVGFDYNKETSSRATSTVRFDKDSKTVVGKGVRNPDAVRRGAGRQYAGGTQYGDWLRTQPAWFQNSVLGETKGRLFRKGGLNISKFSEADGIPLSLSQLKVQNPTAWSRAGLN